MVIQEEYLLMGQRMLLTNNLHWGVEVVVHELGECMASLDSLVKTQKEKF